jgi:hypothetical protein
MFSFAAGKKASSQSNAGDEALEFDDTVSRHVFQGSKPAFRNWKITSQPDEDIAGEEISLSSKGSADDEILVLPPANERSEGGIAPSWLQAVQAVAVFLTMAWIAYATIYILALPGGVRTILSSPLTLGGILASVLAPVALLWLCLAAWQRRSDAHMYAEALRRELQLLLFPTQEQSRAVNRDIQVLVQQAVEMSSSSRAAIKAIQRARQGLRSEIRDFAGVSQKAEFHIDRLTETLNARMQELSLLSDKIEGRSGVIEAHSKEGLESWSRVAAEIADRAQDVENMFANGAGRIQEATRLAENEVSDVEKRLAEAAGLLSSRVGDIATRFAGTSVQIETHAEKLQQVSGAVAREAGRLEDVMSSRVADLEALAQRNIAAIEEAQETTIVRQKEMESGALRIAEAADRVMDCLAEGLGKVDSTADGIITRAEDVERKLANRTEAIEVATAKLADSASGMDHVGEIACHKLGEALSMALSGSETITNSVRRVREQMDRVMAETSDHIARLSGSADSKVTEMLENLGKEAARISGVLDELDQRQMAIDAMIERLGAKGAELDAQTEGTREKLGFAVDHLKDAAEFVGQRTAEPVEKLETTIALLAEQSRNLDERLAARVGELDAGTTKARETADGISQTLRTSLQDLSVLSGQISGHARSVNEQMDQQRLSLKSLMSEAEEKASLMQSLLRTQEKELTASVHDMESRIEQVGQHFSDKSQTVVVRFGEVDTQVRALEESIVGRLSLVDQKSLATREAVRETTDVLVMAASSTLPLYEKAISSVTTLEAKYADLNESYGVASETAITCLNDLGEQLDQRLERLGSGTRETTRALYGLVEELTGSIGSIRLVADEAQDRINTVQSGIRGRAEDLQIVADQVRLKIEGLQKNFGGYMQDFGEVIGRAGTQLQEMTELFIHSTEALDQKADAASGKLETASKAYIEEGHRMSLLAEQAVHKASRIVISVQEETARLVASARDSLTELQKSGDSISIRAREVEEFMKASIRNTQSYGEELRNQAALVGAASSDAVDRLSQAVDRLSGKAEDVRSLGQTVSGDLETVQQKMAEEADRLLEVARTAVETADEATGAFARQSNTLFKAVEDVNSHVEKIRDTQWKTQREAFLSSAKFVIESLYSLAVDVSRHLEDDLDARAFKSYQKGDVAAFARHLVEIAPQIPPEKAQRKFVEDGEFRNYVQRFIRQFEELLEQAQVNDYGDLLSSVFATSDVGNLYRILCEIAGRSAKTH